MSKQGGDDLDDFGDELLVSCAEDEDSSQWDGFDDVQTLMSPDEDGEDKDNQATREKKRKRKEKSKERKAKKRKLTATIDSIEPASITAQPPRLLAEYLTSMQAKTFSTMSRIELEDRQMTEKFVADTTVWTGPRTLDQLGDFIAKVLPTLRIRLSQRSKANGAPTLLFITGAALRVVDVTRVLKDKKLRGEKGGEVAKLFARHFKLEEHVTYLKRTKVGAAIGTPGRIGKLLCETDALSISALSHIMLDVSFQDTKKRTLLDIPETRDEVFKTVLGCPHVLEAIKERRVQVVLF